MSYGTILTARGTDKTITYVSRDTSMRPVQSQVLFFLKASATELHINSF